MGESMRPDLLLTIFNVLIFVGAIIVAIGGFGAQYYGKKVATIEKDQNDQAQVELKEVINTQTEKIKTLSEKNLELSKMNIDVSNDIQQKADELTADGSYPFATIRGELEGGKKSQLLIHLKGRYAIQNLTTKIVIVPDYSTVSGLDLRVLGMEVPPMDIGTLRSLEFKSFFVDTPTKETAITIYYKSNNNSWTDSIRVKDTESGRKFLWYTADKSGDVLNSHIDPNFPNDNGKIVIWSNTTKDISEFN